MSYSRTQHTDTAGVRYVHLCIQKQTFYPHDLYAPFVSEKFVYLDDDFILLNVYMESRFSRINYIVHKLNFKIVHMLVNKDMNNQQVTLFHNKFIGFILGFCIDTNIIFCKYFLHDLLDLRQHIHIQQYILIELIPKSLYCFSLCIFNIFAVHKS